MKKILCLLTFVTMFEAHASIVCKGTSSSSGQPFAIEIQDNQVIVTGGFLKKPRVFNELTEVNGLITAPGLAVTFEDHYGCIRKATIITELREPFGAGYMEVLNVNTCSGGDTADSLCKPSQN